DAGRDEPGAPARVGRDGGAGRAAQDRGLRHALDSRGAVPRRSRRGDDAAPRPRGAGLRRAAAASAHDGPARRPRLRAARAGDLRHAERPALWPGRAHLRSAMTTTRDLTFTPAVELARLYRRRAVSPLEVV